MPTLPYHRAGDYLGRYGRLLEIDAAVRRGDFPSCSSLAQHLGVTAKTVQRDIDHLRYSLEAPLEYDPQHRGWHYTEATFFLPANLWTVGDLRAAVCARQALGTMAGTPLSAAAERAFEALLQAAPEEQRRLAEWVERHVVFAGLPLATVDAEVWRAIFAGMEGGQTLRLQYGERGDLLLDPYGLIASGGEWYLYGWHHRHQARRTLYLPRIQSAEVTEGSFERPPDLDLREYVRGGFEGLHADDTPTVRVKLRFTADVAERAAERPWHPDQITRRGRDGRLTLSFPTDALFQVARRVLSWGAEVEVLAPRSLRAEIAEHARRLAVLYGG